MEKAYYIYLLTNKYLNVIYTGVTNNLIRRVYEHKTKSVKGFTQKYNIEFLVYFESCFDISSALAREKQIKGWSREKKNNLVNSINPGWVDLYDSLL